MKQLSLFEPIASEHRDIHQYIKGDIPIDLSENTFLSLDRKTPLKIYSLGFQPAKSIPEIPRWFLQKYGSDSFTILEPFAGSGTTILESLRYGASVYWLDYNPYSRLICQVKTTKFDLVEVREIGVQILEKAGDRKTAPETVQFSNRDFWFQQPVREGLEILKEYINLASSTIQPLLWLAFAATVRKTSDMNDGMILAAKRSHVKDIPQRSREDTFQYFKFYLDKTLEALGEWQYLFKNSFDNSIQLPLEDAKRIDGDFQINAVVTSPPYINAIDYIWACKFELHWLGLVKNNKERLDLYSRELGTERIPKKEYLELGSMGLPILDCLIEEIYTGQKYKASK
ncbi:MAG: DNA methylase [Spirulina sp.]